jgi:phospholipase/carboxylesterase
MTREKAEALLPCVEIEPKSRATHVVVWLHGLGADGNDFVPIVPHLGLEEGFASGTGLARGRGPGAGGAGLPSSGSSANRRPAVRFVFPHAPSIPVAINMGMVMPAWYDIGGADLRVKQDEAGIRRSAAQVRGLVEREIERGIPSGNIVLAGFSQGGAVAAFTALRFEKPLAGAICLSTYLVLGETLDAEIASANRGLSVFQAHGTSDPMVQLKRGEELKKKLVDVGCDVTWRTYPMQHEVCMEEIEEIGGWLRALLSKSG